MIYLELLLLINKYFTQSSNSPLAILRATKNCLMDQASTYSGTSNAQMNRGRWCSTNERSGFQIYFSIQPFASHFFGQGTLGCTATQVQENIVARQLHTIFQIVLQCVRSLQWFPTNERFSMVGIGPAWELAGKSASNTQDRDFKRSDKNEIRRMMGFESESNRLV